jgi:hypothetical protein
MDVVVLGSGEGKAHSAGSSHILIKATGDETAGTFFLSEDQLAAAARSRPVRT